MSEPCARITDPDQNAEDDQRAAAPSSHGAALHSDALAIETTLVGWFMRTKHEHGMVGCAGSQELSHTNHF